MVVVQDSKIQITGLTFNSWSNSVSFKTSNGKWSSKEKPSRDNVNHSSLNSLSNWTVTETVDHGYSRKKVVITILEGSYYYCLSS